MDRPDATDRLVEHCLGADHGGAPDDVKAQLRHHLLDHLGLVVGGYAAADSTPAFEGGLRGLGGAGDAATALPTGERHPADHAALFNGAMAHSLDFDDTHRESSLHPGAPVVPAALAVAEHEGAPTERLLAGIRAGYDVTATLGRAVNPEAHYGRGFHITATCGTFGATAAAGVVAGLDADELAAAFGVNGSQAAGSLQFLANGAWNKRLHPGLAAARGVTAVSLARAGFRGSADPVEGQFGFFAGYTEDPDPAAFDDLGEREAVLETALKPYPCCRYMHAAIDGLLDLDVDPAAVESVHVALPKSGVTLTGDPIDAKRRPANFVDCQFSMPFAAALALAEGEAGLRAFLDAQDRLDDGELRRLMDATEVEATDEVRALFPERWAARVTVRAGGKARERFVDAARGEPENPLSWDAVVAKFDELTGAAGWDDRTRAAVVEAVEDVESRSVESLVGTFRDAAVGVAAD